MNPSGNDPLAILQQELRKFVAERDWDQFHSPKNLAMALSVEAAELLENFQWLREEDSRRLAPDRLEKVRQEMADVFIYLLRLSDKLEVDLLAAARDKMKLNAQRYPADKAKGSIRKYTEY